MALITNAFYQATLSTSSFIDADDVALYDVLWLDSRQYGNKSGTWAEFMSSRHVVKHVWFALYLATTTVLAVCAIAAVVVTTIARALDLFGGVSSPTRDSAFVTGVPGGGSSLSGAARARPFRNLWVRIQDVKSEGGVWRILFSDWKEFGNMAGLCWHRKYV